MSVGPIWFSPPPGTGELVHREAAPTRRSEARYGIADSGIRLSRVTLREYTGSKVPHCVHIAEPSILLVQVTRTTRMHHRARASVSCTID